MNVTELSSKLFELDIPHYYYNICGGDDDEEQRICIMNEGGKWLVYYCEDGERLELSEFDNESDACAECYDRLVNAES